MPYRFPYPLSGGSAPWEETFMELGRNGEQDPDGRNLLPAIPSNNSTRGVAPSAAIANIIDVRSLGYTYDTLPAPLKLSQKRVVAPKNRQTTFIIGSADRRGDTLVSSFSLSSPDVSPIFEKFKATKDSFFNVIVEGIAPPADDIVKKQVIVRLFVLDGRTYEARPDFFGRSVLGLREYIGVHTFFAHNHGGDEGDNNPSFDISGWLRNDLEKNSPSDLTIVAVALNPQQGYKGVPLFPASSQASVTLELEATV